MPKYKVIIPGKQYMCNHCGQAYEGPNCRNQAAACFDSHYEDDPLSLDNLFRPYDKQPKPPGSGIEYPDGNDHWRRLKPSNPDHDKVNYNKAFHQAENRFREHERTLDRLWQFSHNWNPKYSPLQRLSYAYHHGGWEAVKQAAYALAYSEAVQSKLDNLDIPEIIQGLLSLHKAIMGILEDEKNADAAGLKHDIQYLMTRFEIQNFLDSLEKGEKE